MIKVSLGVKKKEGGHINIDFEPVAGKNSATSISKLYQNLALEEEGDDTGNRKYLGQIHFKNNESTDWKYRGNSLGNFELKQLMRYFKKYSQFQTNNF